MRVLPILSVCCLPLLSLSVHADGAVEMESRSVGVADTDDSKSAASFDTRLPPVIPGENHPDGKEQMKVWSTSGPVPVSRAPEPFKKYDARDLVQGGVSVIIDERAPVVQPSEKIENSDQRAIGKLGE